MKIGEIKDKIRSLKKDYKKIETNFYPGILDDEQEATLFENEKAIVFVVQEPNRYRAFFGFEDGDFLSEILLQIPDGTVMEYIFRPKKNPLKKIFENGNMEKYSTYIRSTICYSGNPFSIPEEGRRKLLEQMYEPTFGEYAEKKDAVELYNLTKKTFDVLCDDVFTLEQWDKIIERKECLLHRENGNIVTFYVWRLEGRKLYSNMVVNEGPANFSYNLERRIFEEMWSKGIRIFYAWYNIKNKKALKRGNEKTEELIKSKEIIYNDIYIKNNNQEEFE